MVRTLYILIAVLYPVVAASAFAYAPTPKGFLPVETLTVSGNTSSTATNVAVNGQTAARYADFNFAKDGLTLSNGSNTFIAIAHFGC